MRRSTGRRRLKKRLRDQQDKIEKPHRDESRERARGQAPTKEAGGTARKETPAERAQRRTEILNTINREGKANARDRGGGGREQ